MNAAWWCLSCGAPRLWPRASCVWCRENVARAERLKLQLGTRLTYMHAASRVDRTGTWLYTQLIVELYRRLGRPHMELVRWVGREEGYCLDAPERIPAGGCVSIHIPDADDDPEIAGSRYGAYIPEQLTIYREPLTD